MYNSLTDSLVKCNYNGVPIDDNRMLKIALQDFHFNSFTEFFGVPVEEVIANKRPRMVVTKDFSIFEELLVNSNNLDSHVEGRIVIIK